jgi:hypothetical protein
MRLEDLEGTNLLGLFPGCKTVVSCTHTATEEKSHLNMLHGLLTLGVIRVYLDANLLTHGKDFFGKLDSEFGSRGATKETEATL